ncbi:phosphate-regulating neutral endopeptidase PHEX-like [Haemaphysalis longicornis]
MIMVLAVKTQHVNSETLQSQEHLPTQAKALSCTSNACVREAQRIGQYVNRSGQLGPCDDFYSFVCQGWLRDNPIMAGFARTSYSLELRERIEAGMMGFIEETISDAGIRPLKRVLADLGLRTWPSVRASEPGVEEVAGRVTRHLGESTVFAVSHGPDLSNHSRNIITV